MYRYAGGNPISITDRMGLACDQRGCWVTPQERRWADNGDWDIYYKTACAGGDPYACRAFEVASGTGATLRNYFLSLMTNVNLAKSIKKNSSESGSCNADIEPKMEAIRVGLARAHANLLTRRGATQANPVMLSRRDISEFHARVFSQNGAGNVFGGDTFDRYFRWFGHSFGYDWCPSPSCSR